jgi:hypothetical protein
MRIAPILLLSAAACVSAKTNPEAPPTGVYVGFFTENAQESIFFPCGTRLAEDGWLLRFKDGVQADKARYQYRGAGFPNSSHDIRVIATLSKPGRYGTGFHTRELVVEKLLDVKNPGEICQVTIQNLRNTMVRERCSRALSPQRHRMIGLSSLPWE